MNEVAAVVSTANATWALVYATVILAVLSLGVIVTAVGVPWWQRRQDRNDERLRYAERAEQAEASVTRTIDLVQEVVEFLDRRMPFEQFPIWALLNRINSQRRVVTYFLGPWNLSARMPYRLSAALQALDEAADGLQRALGKPNGDVPDPRATRRAEGAATAKRALERLEASLATS